MIEVSHIHQSYGSTHVLDDVSLSLRDGCITALIGSNGTGKTTLLNVMANLINDYKGTVLIDGEDVKSLKTIDVAKKIAVMKQVQTLSLRITVRELVVFGRFPHNKGRMRPEDEEKVNESIAYMSLCDIQDRFIDELSGGQRQRAYIAMILAQDTKYVFLDEPLNNLDVKYSIEMMLTLRRLVRELGKTVVIVLHDINFAAAFADEIVAMKDGRIVAEGAASEIVDRHVLGEVFEHDFHIVELGRRKVCVYFDPEDEGEREHGSHSGRSDQGREHDRKHKSYGPHNHEHRLQDDEHGSHGSDSFSCDEDCDACEHKCGRWWHMRKRD